MTRLLISLLVLLISLSSPAMEANGDSCRSSIAAKGGNQLVTLYHHTSGEYGRLINQTGVLKGSPTPGLWRPWKTGDVYLTTKPELSALDRLIYGLPKSKTEAVVQITVPKSYVVTRPFGIRIVNGPIELP